MPLAGARIPFTKHAFTLNPPRSFTLSGLFLFVWRHALMSFPLVCMSGWSKQVFQACHPTAALTNRRDSLLDETNFKVSFDTTIFWSHYHFQDINLFLLLLNLTNNDFFGFEDKGNLTKILIPKFMWLKPSLKEATELDIRTLFILQFYTGTFIYDAISIYINIFSYEFTILLSIPYCRALLFLCSVFMFSDSPHFSFSCLTVFSWTHLQCCVVMMTADILVLSLIAKEDLSPFHY